MPGLGAGCRVPGAGCRVPSAECRVPSAGCLEANAGAEREAQRATEEVVAAHLAIGR